MARAGVALAERHADRSGVLEVAFPGYTLTGRELAAAIASVLGRPVEARPMSWLALRLAAPLWPMGRGLVEMRYLWQMPHRIDGSGFAAALPDFRATPLPEALASALGVAAPPPQPSPAR
jgi:hypothetical protein